MQENKFNVVFRGKYNVNKDINSILKNLSVQFKYNEDELINRYSQNEFLIIKKNLGREAAKKTAHNLSSRTGGVYSISPVSLPAHTNNTDIKHSFPSDKGKTQDSIDLSSLINRGGAAITNNQSENQTSDALKNKSNSSIDSQGKSNDRKNKITIRASKNIWHFEEPEGEVEPGKDRPLLIVDEQTVYLSHTNKRLPSDKLFNRIQTIISAQDVPVDLTLVRVSWLNDPRAERDRIIASLSNHPYSDIKYIMGVDYIGSWAAVQALLGLESEAIPPQTPLNLGIIAMSIGAVFFLFGFAIKSNIGALITFMGMLMGVGGLFFHMIQKRKTQLKIKDIEEKKAIEKLSRTFKVDDMSLFCTAMKDIFKLVVDDIQESGGEIVRISGGKGGFMKTEIMSPKQRETDATEVDV